jgi:hypothetical protein
VVNQRFESSLEIVKCYELLECKCCILLGNSLINDRLLVLSTKRIVSAELMLSLMIADNTRSMLGLEVNSASEVDISSVHCKIEPMKH